MKRTNNNKKKVIYTSHSQTDTKRLINSNTAQFANQTAAVIGENR